MKKNKKCWLCVAVVFAVLSAGISYAAVDTEESKGDDDKQGVMEALGEKVDGHIDRTGDALHDAADSTKESVRDMAKDVRKSGDDLKGKLKDTADDMKDDLADTGDRAEKRIRDRTNDKTDVQASETDK